MKRFNYEKPWTQADRIVWFVCGLLVGVPFGLLAWLIAVAFGLDGSIGIYLFASICAAFAILGGFFGHVLFDILLGLLHFIWGFVAGQTGGPEPQRGAAHWLRVIFFAGAILGAIAFFTAQLH